MKGSNTWNLLLTLVPTPRLLEEVKLSSVPLFTVRTEQSYTQYSQLQPFTKRINSRLSVNELHMSRANSSLCFLQSLT